MNKGKARERTPYSIVRVITFTWILTLACVSGILSIAFYIISSHRETQTLQEQSHQLSNYFAAALGPLLWNYYSSTIMAISQALILRGDIPYFTVVQDNRTLVSECNPLPGIPLYKVEVKYKFQNIGSFAFQLSPANTQVFREGAFSFGLTFFGVLFIAFALILPWVVRRSLASPLKKIQAAAEAYAAGDYSSELLKVTPMKEFLPVTDAFLVLGQRIQTQLDRWKLLNDELEQRVEARTQELTLTNEHLEKTVWDLRQTQEYLVQSEKLASLGKLVAGIAHELNTPLGAIDSSSRTLSDIVNHELPQLLPEFFSAIPGYNTSVHALLIKSLTLASSIKTPPTWT